MNLSLLRNPLHQSAKCVASLVVLFAASALATQAQVVFSPPKNISNSSGNTQAQQIAVDSSGNVNLVWVDTSLGNSEIFFSRSADRGVTFSTPLNVSNDSGDSIFPSIAVDPGGNINLTWTDDTPGFKYDVFFSRSTDAGA